MTSSRPAESQLGWNLIISIKVHGQKQSRTKMSVSEFSNQSFLTAQSSPLPTNDRSDRGEDDTDFDLDLDASSDNPSLRNKDREYTDAQHTDASSSYSFSTTSPSSSTDDENESEDGMRMNRFQGHADRYRNWTRGEHKICQAIDTERSRDLAAHLYNAHALKKRKREGFVPNRKWTAWPMPASIVPREGEDESKDRDDLYTFRRRIDARPSARLEEMIMAGMLREAKLRFTRRTAEVCPGTETNNESHNAVSTDENPRDCQSDEEATGYFERPVVAADDEKSNLLLRPAARHVLSDLDNLLSALHRTRAAYMNLMSVRSSTNHRERPRDARRNPDYDTNDPSRNVRHNSGQKLHAGHARTTPRDWSEVLGLASLSGSWSRDVIMRTANRCSSLFGEDMEFRTFGTGKLVRHDEDPESFRYTEDDSESEHRDAQRPAKGRKRNSRDAGLDVAEQRVRAIFCDVEGCARGVGGRGFSRKWNLHQHQKIAHKKA